MSLRTRLIIAFLLLSVVPLSAVTWFTYASWVDTFEAAGAAAADGRPRRSGDWLIVARKAPGGLMLFAAGPRSAHGAS